jgi:hypothetical protein
MLPGQHHGGVVISKSLGRKVGIRKVQGGLDYLHVHVILGCGNSQIKIPSILVELIDWGTRKAWDIISSLDELCSQGVNTGTLQQRPFALDIDSFFVSSSKVLVIL